MQKKEITYDQAKSKIEALCSQRELCGKEVRDRLQRWGLPLEEHDKLVKHLIEERYVDEKRFALFFAKDKHALSHWGKSKITFELRNRHISAEIIEEAISQIPEEGYEEQLEEMLRKKLKSIKSGTPYDICGKLIRFGLSRGHESGLVIKTAKKIINSDYDTSDYGDEMDNY